MASYRSNSVSSAQRSAPSGLDMVAFATVVTMARAVSGSVSSTSRVASQSCALPPRGL